MSSIGGTIYPGLMVTSTVLYHFLNFFHISIEVRNVCVFLAPLFSSLTSLVTYKLTSELFSGMYTFIRLNKHLPRGKKVSSPFLGFCFIFLPFAAQLPGRMVCVINC